MSDLVRGVVRERPPVSPPAPPPSVPPPPAPPPPAAPPPPPAPEPPPERPPATPRPRTSVGSLPPEPPRPAAPPAPADTAPPPAATPTESAEALFTELQGFLMEVRDIVRAGETLPRGRLESLVERCIVSLRESADLFWLANNPAAPPGLDAVAFHQARVGVLSLRIGAVIGYDRPRLVALGMAGCLLDIGLWQLPEPLLRRMDAPTGEKGKLYRAHPRLAADMIRRWDPPGEQIAAAVLQHHEREQGQGFPQGLQGQAIDNDAKILGLVDTYAGLTTPLTSRPRLRPHEAIRDIVKSRHDGFPSALIKALLSEISVFPPGTIVKLNTEEVGRVIAVNRNHPLRPKVEIVVDSKGHRLPARKTVDLAEAPFLYITGPVTEAQR